LTPQHTYGRREIEIAEQEMPGIMALRKKAKVTYFESQI
jgi:S-adenosylhomocysteine hydrolase